MKTSDALSSHGISTPEPVHERLRWPCCTLTPSVSDGKRVRWPMRSRDVLIERDGVAEAAAARMRRRGEEAVVRRVPAIDVRMRDAAEDGEVVAVLLEHFEIGRERVVAARSAFGKELVRQQAEVVADAEHPARLAPGVTAAIRSARGERGRIASSNGSDEGDAGAAQETAARKRAAGGNEGARRSEELFMTDWYLFV